MSTATERPVTTAGLARVRRRERGGELASVSQRLLGSGFPLRCLLRRIFSSLPKVRTSPVSNARHGDAAHDRCRAIP